MKWSKGSQTHKCDYKRTGIIAFAKINTQTVVKTK